MNKTNYRLFIVLFIVFIIQTYFLHAQSAFAENYEGYYVSALAGGDSREQVGINVFDQSEGIGYRAGGAYYEWHKMMKGVYGAMLSPF